MQNASQNYILPLFKIKYTILNNYWIRIKIIIFKIRNTTCDMSGIAGNM